MGEFIHVVHAPLAPVALPVERMAAIHATVRAIEALKPTTPEAVRHRQLALDDFGYARTAFVIDPAQFERVCGEAGCDHFASAAEPHLRCTGCRQIAYCGAKHAKACVGRSRANADARRHWRSTHKHECAQLAAAAQSAVSSV